MRLDIHHHIDLSPQLALRLSSMSRKLELIVQQQETIMATLDQVLADITEENTRLDSIAALIGGLRQQLADALSGANLPPEVQAKVDAIFTAAEANKGKIDDALNANTPAPPPA